LEKLSSSGKENDVAESAEVYELLRSRYCIP
jgi:hypothetical protein